MEEGLARIAPMLNDPRGLPGILEALREEEEYLEFLREEAKFPEDTRDSIERLNLLVDALHTWRSKWPDAWERVVRTIAPHVKGKQLHYRRRYGVFRTALMETYVQFLADHRLTLIYALIDDAWQSLVKAAAASMGLTTVDVKDGADLARIVRSEKIQGGSFVVHDFCLLSRSYYGELKALLQDVGKEKQTALFGLSLHREIPVNGDWADLEPCDASCMSLVYPFVFPDDLRSEIEETRGWTEHTLEQAIVAVLMEQHSAGPEPVCGLQEYIEEIRQCLNSQ